MRKRIWIPESPAMMKRTWIPESSFNHPPESPQESEAVLNCGFGVSFGGVFIVDLLDAKSGEIKEHYEFPNLITDIGLDEIAQGTPSLFNYLGVGTNATTPDVSDKALGSEIIRINTDGGHSGLSINGGPITGSGGPLDTLYWFVRFVRLFEEDEANGNLAELGWFKDAAAGVMVVRSLFKDDGGTPIVITKTNAEQLRVVYELRTFPPVGENPPLGNPHSQFNSGTVILGATTHSWTGSAINVHNGTWGWLDGIGILGSPMTAIQVRCGPSGSNIINPTGSSSDFASQQQSDVLDLDAYSVGTFERTMLATWATTSVNFGSTGINMFTVRASNNPAADNEHFQLRISESIFKTSSERLRVNFTITVDRAVTS